MKTIVTHTSPDLDAITSVWLLKRFFPGWEAAETQFVSAGTRLSPFKGSDPIENIEGQLVIHVDTGLGPLDHHQTDAKNVCAASLTWDFVHKHDANLKADKIEAISRMVKVVVEIDHFREVFYPDAADDHQEFSLFGLLEGLKLQHPDNDDLYMSEGLKWLDMLLHNFESRVFAEKEIKEKAIVFKTRFGKALGIETINGAVPKLAQKMGFVLVIRKDPRKGNIQIKARPQKGGEKSIDLTKIYQKLLTMDPKATWFLHISKKMLLNGSMKNPDMVASTLSLEQVVKVAKRV